LELASMQVADVILVSTDTRGFELAIRLAQNGWKTVVLELSGGSMNKNLEIEDRFGPFVAFSNCAGKLSQGTEPAVIWLRSGPIALTGARSGIGAAHLSLRYGRDSSWVEALGRSLLSSRFVQRETLFGASGRSHPSLPWANRLHPILNVLELAVDRRRRAIEAGVRILDVDQLLNFRIQDKRIDRIELRTITGEILRERMRSVVWLLSLEESLRPEFVSQQSSIQDVLEQPSFLEPMMIWWRCRGLVSGLKGSKLPASLQKPPMIPSHTVMVGSLERPWTHENVMCLDLIEFSNTSRVMDVWMRIPHWSRFDHVYRDEQRRIAHELLIERLPACELEWSTASPLSHDEASIRTPHVVYSDDSVSPKSSLANVLYAGPEVWRGVGLIGAELCETDWIKQLEELRMDWDPAARVRASRAKKIGFKIKSWINSDSSNESEIMP
jgi:hypothetical protein